MHLPDVWAQHRGLIWPKTPSNRLSLVTNGVSHDMFGLSGEVAYSSCHFLLTPVKDVWSKKGTKSTSPESFGGSGAYS